MFGSVVADGSGAVFIPRGRADEVLRVAAELAEKEQQMLADIRSGAALLEVDQQHAYEQMLRRPES